MNQMIHNYVVYEAAGLWAMVWEYGLGAVLILICLAAAYFSPFGKKDFLYAAGVIAILMISFTAGVSTGEKRIQAQWDAARVITNEAAKQARAGALRDVARKPSRWLSNKPDPLNRDGQ